jgi:hypothetical protein
MSYSVQSFSIFPILVLLTAASMSTEPQQDGLSGGLQPVAGEIDGAQSPEAVPDVVAYQHFFGLLAATTEQTGADARRRSYIKAFFSPACGPDQKEDRTLSDLQIEKLFRLAEELADRVLQIESTFRSKPIEFSSRRDRAIQDAIDTLPERIDSDAAYKIQRHVLQHVKRRIRILNVTVGTSPTAQ